MISINDYIEEAVGQTITLRTRDAKIRALAGLESMKIAKEKGTPEYKKYVKFNHKRLFLKQAIMKKYMPLALQRAREKLRRIQK